MLHAAAGRAFTRTSAREYHPSAFPRSDAAVIAGRRRKQEAGGNVGSTSWHALPGSSTVYPMSRAIPGHSPRDEGPSAKRLLKSHSRAQSLPKRRAKDSATRTSRSSRPTRHDSVTCRIPTHRGVVAIDVETLSSFDVSYVDPGRNQVLPYQDEPPWPDISEALLVQRKATSVSGGPVWTPPNDLPTPRSSYALYQNLLRFASYDAAPALHQVINYHNQYPSLRNTRSFNYLIALSIRYANVAAVRRLFVQMESAGISDNVETRMLKVRFLIRRRQWHAAWRMETAKSTSMPLAVWLEFFEATEHKFKFDKTPHSSRHGTFNFGTTDTNTEAGDLRPDEQGPEWMEGVVPPEEVLDELPVAEHYNARIDLLMHHLPSVTPSQWASPSIRVVHRAVSWLLRCQRWEVAETTTMKFFKTLPSHLDRRTLVGCLELIHLNMSKPRTRALPEFYRVQTMLGRMLHAHPSFRPNSTTLGILLAPLKKTLKCGTVAWHTVAAFREQWGPTVMDDRVRRRVMALALKEGRQDIVESMATEQHYVETQRRMWIAEREVRGGPVTEVPKRLSRRPVRKLAASYSSRLRKAERQLRVVVQRRARQQARAASDGSS